MILDTLVEDPNHTGLQMYNPLDGGLFCCDESCCKAGFYLSFNQGRFASNLNMTPGSLVGV